jgi:ribosomal protein S18 acetylase RimI-like enzyme
LAAVADNRIVGIVGLACSRAEKTRHIGQIWGLYVRPFWRRSGVAKRLLEAAISDAMHMHTQAWMSDIRSLRICAEANNKAAVELYKALGFTAWAVEKQALWVDDRFHDEVHMRLDFEQPRT